MKKESENITRKKRKNKKVYDLNIVPVNYSELNFREKVFLRSVIKNFI